MPINHITQDIAHALSNVLSWRTDNLEQEFADYVSSLQGGISPDAARRILASFEALNPLERDSAYFDLEAFVEMELQKL